MENNNTLETTASSKNTIKINVFKPKEEYSVNDLETSIKLSLNDSMKIIQRMLKVIDINIEDETLKNKSLETMSNLLLDLKSSTEETQKKVINSFEKKYFLEEE